MTHAQRWKHAHGTVGQGHLYQGRFKSFPIEQDDHLLIVLRYVERNPVRAGVIAEAQWYRWGSAFVRAQRSHELRSLLHPWPVDRPRRWIKLVNEPQTPAEEASGETVHSSRSSAGQRQLDGADREIAGPGTDRAAQGPTTGLAENHRQRKRKKMNGNRDGDKGSRPLQVPPVPFKFPPNLGIVE